MTASLDPLQDLADAVIVAIAAAFPTFTFGGVVHPVAVQWTDDATIELSDAQLADPLVWVVDMSEHHGCERSETYEEYELVVIVQMKIPAAADKAAFSRAMAQLVRGIMKFIKPLDESFMPEIDGEGTPCISATTNPPRKNLVEWKDKRRYYSEIVSKWRRY